jgi:predicted nucleic acid-binding protein
VSDKIDGENQAQGIRLPLSDLLIGVTALELGYGIATGNLRHFQMIPGLSVVQL